jgi:sugar lactone lactonase YvrE
MSFLFRGRLWAPSKWFLLAVMASVPTSTLAQTISTYAGDGAVAYFCCVSNPSKIALDSDGNFYVSDSLANKVFRITPRGIMTTVAGSGVKGYDGDGGDARSAKLNNPAGVNHDRLGNLFITDSGNMVIRKVAPTGAITTVAGNGTQGDTGDGGPAINAQMDLPEHVVVDAEENLFVAEYGGNRVRRVAADGTISTVAGTGLQGYAGDGGPAINA